MLPTTLGQHITERCWDEEPKSPPKVDTKLRTQALSTQALRIGEFIY